MIHGGGGVKRDGGEGEAAPLHTVLTWAGWYTFLSIGCPSVTQSNIIGVSPAYGFSALALVKCKVQGPDTTWRRIQGPLLWSWRESMGKRYLVTQDRWQVFWEPPAPLSLPPHQGTQDRTPSHPLSEGTPLPQHQYHWRPASEKAHFGLGYKIRGHGMGKRRMRRPLWAFQLLFRRPDSWASDWRRMTSALPYSATLELNEKSMAGQYHKTGQWQAGTGQESI